MLQSSVRRPSTLPAVRQLSIPQSVVSAGDARTLVDAVVGFVDFCTHEACYEREELPREGLQAYHVDYYVKQVDAGGHAQFAGNSGMMPIMVADIERGLSSMGLVEHRAIWHELVAYSKVQPMRFDAVAQARGVGISDAKFAQLDERYRALGSQAIVEASAAWLRRSASLRPVGDADYDRELHAIAQRNPVRAERAAEKEHIRAAEHARDPVAQVLMLLCAKAEPAAVEFEGWIGGRRSIDRDGVGFATFELVTSAGRAEARVHPNEVQLWLGGTGPAVRLPAALAEDFVERQTGRSLYGRLGLEVSVR